MTRNQQGSHDKIKFGDGRKKKKLVISDQNLQI